MVIHAQELSPLPGFLLLMHHAGLEVVSLGDLALSMIDLIVYTKCAGPKSALASNQ